MLRSAHADFLDVKFSIMSPGGHCAWMSIVSRKKIKWTLINIYLNFSTQESAAHAIDGTAFLHDKHLDHASAVSMSDRKSHCVCYRVQ